MPLASAPQGGEGEIGAFLGIKTEGYIGVFKLSNRGQVVYGQPLKGNHHRRKEHAKHSLFTQKRFLHNFL
jgi:hypothetical protein